MAALWWSAGVALVAAGLLLNALNLDGNAGLTAPLGHDAVFSLWAAAYTTVGAVVGARRPANPIGWMLLAAGLVFAAGSALFEYANHGLDAPGSAAALWFADSVTTLAPATIALAVLLFPDGRPAQGRWRAAHWLPIASGLALLFGYALYPGAIDSTAPSTTNPAGIAGAGGVLEALQVVGWALLAASMVAAGSTVVVRLRSSTGAVHQQMKWVAAGGAALGVTWAWNTLLYVPPFRQPLVTSVSLLLVTLGFCAVPVSMGVAILRYRLYEIDVVIRRTLTYGVLVSLLASVYLGCVAVLGGDLRSVSGESGTIAVTVSTLAVAGLFRPALERIRRAVDRRFYRAAYDSTGMLAGFAGRLRQRVDLDALEADLLGVVSQTVQPAHATLWLRHRPDQPGAWRTAPTHPRSAEVDPIGREAPPSPWSLG